MCCLKLVMLAAVFVEFAVAESNVSTTVAPRDIVVHRTGKRGPVGPQGLQGPPGAPGICLCAEGKWKQIESDYKALEEHIERIRRTSPETFCLLGMKDGTIPDDAITVSSRENFKTHGRLDSLDGWYPISNHIDRVGREWIMADMGRVRNVTGVITQGRGNSNHWVKTFKVEHSIDGQKFVDIVKEDGSERIFNGNVDRNTKVVNRFPKPVQTRFVRIYPMSFTGYQFIRFDIIDC